ncbi:hypothetical protein DFAR_1980006 [Desulfarculales bacterium]
MILCHLIYELVVWPLAFSLVTGQRREMCLMDGQEQETVVEMRVADTPGKSSPPS